jgi:hypothetical protein
MDSNYKWQQHQAGERLQARMREAETHRMLKSDSVQRDSLLMRIWKKLIAGVAPRKLPDRREIGTAGPAFRQRPADRTTEKV